MLIGTKNAAVAEKNIVLPYELPFVVYSHFSRFLWCGGVLCVHVKQGLWCFVYINHKWATALGTTHKPKRRVCASFFDTCGSYVMDWLGHACRSTVASPTS